MRRFVNAEHAMPMAKASWRAAGLAQGGHMSRWAWGFLSGLFREAAILSTGGQ